MKKAFVYGLLVALAITGCQAELEEVSNNEPDVISQETTKVFTAIVDEDFNSETKTSLDGSGNVLWKKGDQVSIFAASTVNEQYQVSDDSDGKTAATLNKIPGGGFVAGGEIDNNVAFYPYASTAEIAKSGSNYVISKIELPATQTYAASSFGNGAFPMATVTSSTEDMNLKFKNVLGGLKLQLKGTATITSITVTGNNNEILCGNAEVTTTYGGVPSIVLTDASAKTVTLNCGAGVTLDLEIATPFIIALPPMTMTGGFTVVVTDTEGKQMQIKTTKPQTITRSNLLKMPAVNYVGAAVVPEGAVDLGLSVMWASCNLCDTGFTSSPEVSGDLYAWGETESKSTYNWGTYKWYNSSSWTISMTKYVPSGHEGKVDRRSVLLLEDDAANAILGGNWRMPTSNNWWELINNCTWTLTTQNGVAGRLITGPNGNSIFLPVALTSEGGPDYDGTAGYYWSSSLYIDYSYAQNAYRLDFITTASPYVAYDMRSVGMCIRPVITE